MGTNFTTFWWFSTLNPQAGHVSVRYTEISNIAFIISMSKNSNRNYYQIDITHLILQGKWRSQILMVKWINPFKVIYRSHTEYAIDFHKIKTKLIVTGHQILRSYSKNPWFYLLNAILLANEQSLPILDVLGLTRPAQAGLELMTYSLLSESTTLMLRQPKKNASL
jgi:hypothetical protein